MSKPQLNPKIFAILKKKIEGSDNSIKIKITRLKNKHYLSSNASAEMLAKSNGFSVSKHLSLEEKKELRDKEIVSKPKIELKKAKKYQKKIIDFIKYSTSDTFLKKHIEEVNKAYTHKCYTSAFIISRKVIENLIFQIVKKKCERTEKNLYVTSNGSRIQDLSVLLDNIKNIISIRVDPDEKELLLRIVTKAKAFKNEANNKTHSLYHISNKPELDSANPQEILDLINEEFEKFID